MLDQNYRGKRSYTNAHEDEESLEESEGTVQSACLSILERNYDGNHIVTPRSSTDSPPSLHRWQSVHWQQDGKGLQLSEADGRREEDASEERHGHEDLGNGGSIESGRWSNEEHARFVEGLEKFGKRKWIRIAEHVGTRTVIQVRSHAQKYFKKVRKEPEEDLLPPISADGFSLLFAAAGIIEHASDPTDQAFRTKRPRTEPVDFRLVEC